MIRGPSEVNALAVFFFIAQVSLIGMMGFFIYALSKEAAWLLIFLLWVFSFQIVVLNAGQFYADERHDHTGINTCSSIPRQQGIPRYHPKPRRETFYVHLLRTA